MTEKKQADLLPGAAVRACAADALHAVREHGESLANGLPGRLNYSNNLNLSKADQSLLRELVYGSLRLLPRLEALIKILLKHAIPTRERVVDSLICIGLYQLLATRIPPHAAVSATVAATRILGKTKQAGLINALLRRFLREREQLLNQIEQIPTARWLFPEWLLTRIQKDWPNDWEKIVAVSNGRAPMTLRVNLLRTDLEKYLNLLINSGIEAVPILGSNTGIKLKQACPMKTLPGFAQGLVSIQDEGAQLATLLLNPQPGQWVLDACAAPGGKTAHLLEHTGNNLNLIALDQDESRLSTLRVNLDRLGLTAQIIQGDATLTQDKWAAHQFARILLDAPCTATGVIRRHPEIKWLRRASDLETLAHNQACLLNSLWPLLAPAGRLLYVTCSILAQENQDQIAAFLARTPNARELPLMIDGGRLLTHGYQWLPSVGGNDGFYYALLEKI